MALGKGLGSLIPPKQSDINIANQVQTSQFKHAQDSVSEVAIKSIVVNPHQPRRHFDHEELDALIKSVKQYGILQPLLVSPLDDGYQLIAGERRLRSARMAGLSTVPVIIRDTTELESIELALIENIQRSDLNAIEKADSYHKLVNEFGLNHEEAAKKLGVSRSSFSNTLRLLDLPGEAQKAVADKKITEGHAKILAGLQNASKQLSWLKRIIKEQLSVRALEQLLRGDTFSATATTTKKTPVLRSNPQVASYEDELTQRLATKVHIKSSGKGGTLQIKYYSLEELSGIVRKITKR